MAFGNENRSAQNKGTYGTPLPPNAATRVAPSKWVNSKFYLTAGTYNDFIVPQNVYQVLAIVVGGGGSGAAYASGSAVGGGGGGFASGIIDVVPGQKLPTITVGAGGTTPGTASSSTGLNGSAGGTSSIGSILSATGGSGGTYAQGTITAAAGGTGAGCGSAARRCRGAPPPTPRG